MSSVDSASWFEAIPAGSAEIQQGDLLDDCPLFSPASKFSLADPRTQTFNWEERDVIVLSQSCDLAAKKIKSVLLCYVWDLSTFVHLRKIAPKPPLTEEQVKRLLEEVRRGNRPAFHMLHHCELDGLQHEQRIVELRRVFVLPLATVSQFSARNARLRLRSPYREHLSQAFARFFMRVGLPSDIPPFIVAEQE